MMLSIHDNGAETNHLMLNNGAEDNYPVSIKLRAFLVQIMC